MRVWYTFKKCMTKIWGQTVRQKLFFSYAIIVITAIVLLSIYSAVQSKEQIRNNMESTMNILVQNLCGDIEKNISQSTNAMMNVANNRGLFRILQNGYDPSERIWPDMNNIFIPTMKSILQSTDCIDTLTIYTIYDVPEQGNYVLREERIKNEPWYNEVMDNYAIHWFWKNDECFAAWELRNLWVNSGKEHMGILYLKMKDNVLSHELITENGEQFLFKIMDDRKNVIFPQNDTMKFEIVDENNMLINDEQFMYQEKRIMGVPWTLVLYASKNIAYKGLYKIISFSLIIIIACLICLGIPSVVFLARLSKNILKLSYVMKEVGCGNLDVEINIHQRDEIGIMADQMKEMIKRLKHTIQILYQTEIDRQKQEIKTLQAQINPHFLYNALSIIQWTAMDEEADDTIYLVEQLSNFYRTSLNNGETMTTFKNELQSVKAYINMERVVYNNKFDIEFDIDSRVYDYLCINFILQPIIENAIFHGIQCDDNTTRGKIKLTIKVNEYIEMTVWDNGCGMTQETIETILSSDDSKNKKGYGLYNINKRIKLIFGNQYGLDIKSGKSGTYIIIRIPAKKRAESKTSF